MQYLQKSMRVNLIFGLKMNTNVFDKLIVSLWICVARHVQSTQNNKLTTYFQYLMENLKDKLEFLHADERQRLLQIAIINLVVRGQACPNHPE